MKKFTARIPPEIAHRIQHMHPLLKKRIRRALEEIEANPYVGKPLREPLKGLLSFRVSQYRIIYQIRGKEVWIEIIDIDLRKIVYQKIATLLGKITDL